MHRFLSGSRARLLTAAGIAVVLVVWAYETRVLDSQTAAAQPMAAEIPPEPGKTLPFKATAYCKGTTTASGVRVRSGIAAADPQLLPVGSVLDIKASDDRYSGVYTVLDTGPAVQGRILDLYIWSCHEALTFGRRPVQVTVLRLGWDPKASSPAVVERLFGRREASRRPPAPRPPAPQAF
jgi:3D (Asp-Asp-Asp) domain-containing protein